MDAPTTAARALVIQHDDDAPAGVIGDWAAERAMEIVTVRPDRGDSFPDPGGADFVVSLGSARSVHDREPAWIRAELDWLRTVDRASVPILGICFGAQLLSLALGGAVAPSANPEIGWIAVETCNTQKVASGPWFAYHRDVITPPPLAREIARNEFGPQAFLVGTHLAVQFHPEVTAPIVAGWMADAGLSHPMDDEEFARNAKHAHRLFDFFTIQGGVRPGPVVGASSR